MKDVPPLPRYDRHRSYEWNFDHAPDPVHISLPDVPGEWRFCGMPIGSPLGIPAGPLLNGRWVLYYASLGFDVLTYKTVRSVARRCYPQPNLLPVVTGPLHGKEQSLRASDESQSSWAVSFGMPSKPPDFWRHDVEQTRRQLPAEKLLSVSVVGTVQEGWTIDQLADDYARCARWAVESGADCVETNFSCPNVATCDGQLYQEPPSAGRVAQRVRAAIDEVPLIVKIGHLDHGDRAAELLDALHPHVDALAMTNSVATTIESASGKLYFGGERRGICGRATRDASIDQVRLFAELVGEAGLDMRLIGVGGAGCVSDVRAYLDAGAEHVHIATAAMQDPLIGRRIREELAVE